MEVIHKSPKLIAPQEDFISTMPDNVLTNILDRLPLQDAVRTGVLARSWRYNWTTLSQLVFDEDFFKYLLEKEDEKKDYGTIISGLLLHIKGGITKFVLYILERCKLDEENINHWLLFLSTKGVKDITLWKCREIGGAALPPNLPTHLFSCLELKHLKLFWCRFDPPTTFHGFPNLLSLELTRAIFITKEFGKFFTRSPILENLNLGITFPWDIVKLNEIAKLANLKALSMNLVSFLETITCSDSIFELVGSLPKLQELHLEISVCDSFTKVDDGKRSSNAFPCIKVLKLTRIHLHNIIMLSCALELIRGFPNLQTLEITASECDDDLTPEIRSPEVYSSNTLATLQLRSVVLKDLKGSENEVVLIKYILASSPFLKKIVIRTLLSEAYEEKFLFAGRFLKLQRVYPNVDIDLY
ncbi:F-box/FBD/LRR-repeat protein At1g13570-like [Bidens hawaiensis]|uniref:F-box/FBD/LRR-repeat protein At1g13570-like n=1 Tax=Bidens hawaiensis TaxID=980011 RepID=UPI00404B2A7F